MSIIYAFFASLGFAFLFEIKKVKLAVASACVGALGWSIYLLLSTRMNIYIAAVIATLGVSAVSEAFARIFKSPVTLFLVIGVIPLVPGADIYYTMRYLLSAQMENFGSSLLRTLLFATAIAVGCSMVTAVMKIHRAMLLSLSDRKSRSKLTGTKK